MGGKMALWSRACQAILSGTITLAPEVLRLPRVHTCTHVCTQKKNCAELLFDGIKYHIKICTQDIGNKTSGVWIRQLLHIYE